MAASFGCKCDERRKPVSERDWVVLDHQSARSDFNAEGYSTVRCNACGESGRTRAKYRHRLRNGGAVPLTTAQEIRKLIAERHDNETIADELGIDPHRVATERRDARHRAKQNRNYLNHKQTREQVLYRIECGQRTVDIARRVGCSEDLIYRIRRGEQ